MTKTRRTLPNGSTYWIYRSYGKGYLQKFSIGFNPSRVLNPRGWSLASYEEAPEALEYVMADAARAVNFHEPDPRCWARVDRYDLAQDIEGVGPADRLIACLENGPHSGASTHLMSNGFDEDTGLCTGASLYVHGGHRSRTVLVYNKTAEWLFRRETTAGGPPPGTVRVEARLGPKRIKHHRLQELPLDPEALRRAFDKESAWAGVWSTVVAEGAIEDYLSGLGHEDGLKTRRGVEGFSNYLRLTAIGAGRERHTRAWFRQMGFDESSVASLGTDWYISCKQEEKYRPMHHRLGVAPATSWRAGSPDFAARLVPLARGRLA